MKEGNSAGGGHQSSCPAPPAVQDCRPATLAKNINQQFLNQGIQTQSDIIGSALLLSSGPLQTHSIQNNQQRNISSQVLQHPQAHVIVTHVNPQHHSKNTSSIVSSDQLQIIRICDSNPCNSDSSIETKSGPDLISQSNIGTQVSDTSGLAYSSARKRLRSDIVHLSVAVANEPTSTEDELNKLKKRILEYKFAILTGLKERYSEHVAELFFLQTDGNMMDYPTWRKKPPSPQFVSYTKSYRLDGLMNEESNRIRSNKGTTSSPLSSHQGAEIKIPCVGATPVAVSTTLPAALVQLNQQGQIPGRPLGGRHGMVFGQIPVLSAIGNTSVPLVPGGTPILPDVSIVLGKDKQNFSILKGNIQAQNIQCVNDGSTNSDQFSVKAKQEVYVMQRISELQREGLWTEKRLPKLQEPSRPKAHWDYLLEEMVWLAADFAQERKWKKNAAKKCARMVQKYFQDKASATQRAEKAQEIHLKRVAAFIAKEVKNFWSNVEKLVEYKHQTKLEEKRKRALDQHLSFIVDQTEKFSQQLAEGMNKKFDTSTAPSINSSRISSPTQKQFSDDEFCPANEMSEDDEETIAKAEAEADDVNEEVMALQRESTMGLDEILKDLPHNYLEPRDSSTSEDDEFSVGGSSSCNEAPNTEQQRAEKNMDHNKDLKELGAENGMNMDELLAKYKRTAKIEKAIRKAEKMELDSDDEDEDDKILISDDEVLDVTTSEDDDVEDDGLKSLMFDENDSQSQHNKDNLINDAAAIAESIQPKGNTLSSTNVVTPVPFLLKHSLREYQHIGLDWLVTMNDKKLNGILADEMGLGKTIQTIALLAHLACVKANWGPHLIVVPSSVMLNWEMEFKKWCPGFKILTYYGTQKERKQKRVGWTKFNAFHVCITSYKLVIQDQQSFRRKKWKYFILDEAQNIKNFKSQRWQLLLNFQTERRLLLTGTPLQNNLMELWSLMHFLMPHVFQSHREFKEWFANPMTGMIEGNSEYNDSIIKRLHKVLRPFLLRRLKSEVEKQMPKKYEHVVMCRLSKRQRFLYDDFMSRTQTRETLASGNLLSVINILMQLRKVCNHPNLFEGRPTISPFRMEGLIYWTASIVTNILNYNPFEGIDLTSLNLQLLDMEEKVTAYVSHRSRKLATPKKILEQVDSLPESKPQCPVGKYKFHVRITDTHIRKKLICHGGVKVGTSPAMKTEGNKLVPVVKLDRKQPKYSQSSCSRFNPSTNILSTPAPSLSQIVKMVDPSIEPTDTYVENVSVVKVAPRKIAQRSQAELSIRSALTTDSAPVVTFKGQLSRDNKDTGICLQSSKTQDKSGFVSRGSQHLVVNLAQQLKTNKLPPVNYNSRNFTEGSIVPSFYFCERGKLEKNRRQHVLQLMARINQRRCDGAPIYGIDLRETICMAMEPCKNLNYSTWSSRSYVNTLQASCKRDSWILSKLVKSFEVRTREMIDIVTNYVLFVPAVSSPVPFLHVSHLHPSTANTSKTRDLTIRSVLSPKLTLLNPIISAMKTQFPDPRLIQYDCGKLQTLDKLLRKLKQEGHRVLIFTQMTRMLDVLESFLNYHGHIYLRLDGSTRIDQRQILMEKFNGDKRIFSFILSTRSGGVGVNLTGADTVIFYDSDWNPTMDAQAQDRCHRIGQTRDVHIYRLVSERTIEENILRKAYQKRLLGDLAIEGGNFTTAYFKSSTIQDIFHVVGEHDPTSNLSDLLEKDLGPKHHISENVQNVSETSVSAAADEKTALGVFESALAAAEDEQDVEAATTARAEAAADLAEFDENIPLDEIAEKQTMSKADVELENLVQQLSPIERYAMRFVEETGGEWTAEQLRAAEEEIEQQKREWEANRLAALQKEADIRREDQQDDECITYSREDAKNQIWISTRRNTEMPIWCPPTPPQNDNDIYIDYSLGFLYENNIMSELQLPPIYVKKEYKRTRTAAGFTGEGKRPIKLRKEDNYYAPRSIFDRPSPALAKLRRDLKLQRHRGVFKPNLQASGLKQPFCTKTLTEPEGTTEWGIYEDVTVLHVLQNLQGLPLNLMLLSPGHTPNWDLVAEIVNHYSRTYRSPKQCRYRYEAVIVPREEGKLLESPKKQKKQKVQAKPPVFRSGVKSMRTSQLFIGDNNNSFTKLAKHKFENIKVAYLKKKPPPKQVFGVNIHKNPKHVAVLNDFGVINYDCPLSPIEIALKKAEKLKEKQRSTLNLSVNVHQPQESQQPAKVLVQQSAQVANVQQQVTQIMQPSMQRQSQQSSQMNVLQPQIVKAIVNSTPGILTGPVHHISQPISQQVQLQQTQIQSAGNLMTPSSVSVVLSTPVSTLSSIHHTTQSTQISQMQQTIASAPTIVTPSPDGSVVQTISTQSLPQVISVSQQLAVGPVLTTCANLQSNASVTTLNSSTIRGQRMVANPHQLQEVVLHQRSNSQSPTIVSMTSLAQGVVQPQLQATQLRLAQQVIAKGITVGSLQQSGKISNQPNAAIQLYRQQPIRQHLKVLQTTTSQGNTLMQTGGGQTALVNASGAIIQSGIVSSGHTMQMQGQKVATASGVNVLSTAPGVVSSVATVQVAPIQGRTQLIKHIGIGAKHTITRQVSDNEMLLVKRPIIGQAKSQVVPQSPIYAQTNVQIQQSGNTSQQQIAALVKTSQGPVSATVGMALSQLKPGPIKVTMANQSQMKQLQLQQQIAMAQQRKAVKTQIPQVSGKASVPTQLIVQSSKNLSNSVTVQQIQQVIRHSQPGSSIAGQLVFGKTSVGRVIPVSVASPSNARQTIQVVSATSAQAVVTGNIRNTTNVGNTIKVGTNATQVQTQQALINVLQQSQQNQPRQNASPVRLQTSGATLVTVPVQQVQSTANVPSTSSGPMDVVAVSHQQQTAQQQVRTLVKKRLLSFRGDKEQQ